MEILIQNATIIDGTGAPSYTGNVGIDHGRLLLQYLPQTADLVINARGKILCPGFIDCHSHGDELIGSGDFGALCKVNQGVTTQITGQCGMTLAPSSKLHAFNPIISPDAVNPELLHMSREGTAWTDYMAFIEKTPKVTNIKPFVGFNAIRVAVMGYDDRKPTAEELEQMKALLREAMEAGAAGMSSGLAYVPATYSGTEELIELAKVMAPYGGIYTSHIRNESHSLLESVNEAIEIGRQAGVPVNISHFKIMGKGNWGKHTAAIAAIEKARAEGVDVTCDQYPYHSSMTIYTPCIPPRHFSEGTAALLEKLKSPEFRALVKKEILDPATNYENFYLNCGGWEGITFCTSPNIPEAEGLTVAEYARRIGKDPFEAYFDLVIANEGRGTATYHCISDEDIYDIIRLPYVMVGSDGIVSSRYEKCHPRGWGTMIRAICAFTKEKPILPLEELIHRITGLPAGRYRLGLRGEIRHGYEADLVLLDYANLKDNATYTDPTGLAGGIEWVMVGGRIVYRNGKLTGEKPGKLLRRGSP